MRDYGIEQVKSLCYPYGTMDHYISMAKQGLNPRETTLHTWYNYLLAKSLVSYMHTTSQWLATNAEGKSHGSFSSIMYIDLMWIFQHIERRFIKGILCISTFDDTSINCWHTCLHFGSVYMLYDWILKGFTSVLLSFYVINVVYKGHYTTAWCSVFLFAW